MNTVQMKYFITLAERLSFTDASRQLFISQPSLSKQISVIEDEVGVQLFIRNKRNTFLTPAGESMYQSLKSILSEYEAAINQAKMVDKSHSETLRIGILEFQIINDRLSYAIQSFTNENPCVSVEVVSCSYSELIKNLYTGNLDIAVNVDFEITPHSQFLFKKICTLENYLVVPDNHPKADKENLSIRDFKDDYFLGVEDTETPNITRLMRASCRAAGFEPKMRIARNYRDMMIMLENRQGLLGLSEDHYLHNSSHLKFIKIPEIGEISLVAAWNPNNEKKTIKAFMSAIPA